MNEVHLSVAVEAFVNDVWRCRRMAKMSVQIMAGTQRREMNTNLD
jgi:hypothetical protein